PATAQDLPEILQIEEACFSAPWTSKMLEAELTGNQFARFLVAREEPAQPAERGRIVGYLCFWIVFEEVRFMNLAVIESMRRRGIARRLVATALEAGLSHSSVRAVLEVRSSNLAAQQLYYSLGFRRIGLRPKYYTQPIEDAVLMELEPIVPPSASSSPFLHHADDQEGMRGRHKP
ncbi:MAG TPA: ribosomal protein S18-alanine N-acetyltransferase, partial [Nitrospira sp.]|nr:ribosomal protein S18-alanine N-acetyltransferase [Nitrospira sp.]